MTPITVAPTLPMRIGEWIVTDQVDAKGFEKWELCGWKPVVLLVVSEPANSEEADGWFDVLAVTHDGRRYSTDFSNPDVGTVYRTSDGEVHQIKPHGSQSFCLQWFSDGNWQSL